MGIAAQATLGEPVTLVAPREGYRLWAPCYDDAPNPLLALEARLLAGRTGVLDGLRVLDAGCGTGRWMRRLLDSGARVAGFDFSLPMLRKAAAKPDLAGRCAVADVSRLPVRDNCFDLSICSFTLSYVPDLFAAVAELARVARTVIASDLHPDAARRGWTRSFRAEGRAWEIEHSVWSLNDLDAAARDAGLIREWREEAHFGEPERVLFQQAGKESAFAAAAECPAVLITSWTKRSS